MKPTICTVDPPSHWGAVMKNFAKQCSHDFKHYLLLKSLYIIVLLGKNYGAERITEKWRARSYTEQVSYNNLSQIDLLKN